MNARDSESNEGEDAGELHFERLLGSLESDWNGCLIVLLIVVLECLLLVLRTGGCPPFIDKIDETIWPPATDCLVLFLRSQKLSNITNCFSRGLLIQLLSSHHNRCNAVDAPGEFRWRSCVELSCSRAFSPDG